MAAAASANTETPNSDATSILPAAADAFVTFCPLLDGPPVVFVTVDVPLVVIAEAPFSTFVTTETGTGLTGTVKVAYE